MVSTQVQNTISTPITHTASINAGDHHIELNEKVANKKDLIEKNSDVDLKKLTDELNSKAKDSHLDVSFAYDKELNKVYINVIDKDSGKVIRKLPSEEAMKFAKSIKESIGKLLDRRV